MELAVSELLAHQGMKERVKGLVPISYTLNLQTKAHQAHKDGSSYKGIISATLDGEAEMSLVFKQHVHYRQVR